MAESTTEPAYLILSEENGCLWRQLLKNETVRLPHTDETPIADRVNCDAVQVFSKFLDYYEERCVTHKEGRNFSVSLAEQSQTFDGSGKKYTAKLSMESYTQDPHTQNYLNSLLIRIGLTERFNNTTKPTVEGFLSYARNIDVTSRGAMEHLDLLKEIRDSAKEIGFHQVLLQAQKNQYNVKPLAVSIQGNYTPETLPKIADKIWLLEERISSYMKTGR